MVQSKIERRKKEQGANERTSERDLLKMRCCITMWEREDAITQQHSETEAMQQQYVH